MGLNGLLQYRMRYICSCTTLINDPPHSFTFHTSKNVRYENTFTYPRHVALFSQKFQNASRWFLYHLQATCIVGEGNMGKLDLLLAILKRRKVDNTALLTNP